MSKTKFEKIASIEQEIEQLKNRHKKLLQEQKAQERKDRTKRLCKRAGLLESMLPDSIPLTDELFKTFLEKTVANEYGRRMLANIATRCNTAPNAKPTKTAQQSGTGERANEGDGEASTPVA